MYDYREAIREDIREAVKEYMNYHGEIECSGDLVDAYDDIYEELWIDDSVTGNASGSYTFSTYDAEENICHNMDLAAEAYEEFGYEGIPSEAVSNPEAIDVTIRCYLLGQELQEILEEIDAELPTPPIDDDEEETDDEEFEIFLAGN